MIFSFLFYLHFQGSLHEESLREAREAHVGFLHEEFRHVVFRHVAFQHVAFQHAAFQRAEFQLVVLLELLDLVLEHEVF